MSIFQFGDSFFNCLLLICRNLVFKFFELLLGLEDQRIGLVQLFDLVFSYFISFFIGLGLCLHLFDLSL